jgi:MinD-like ATPase involved in chromosome partitioning or flagellar assembly
MVKVISIQSFRRGAGKSTLVTNIAAALTLASYRVGVIDFNFAAPSLDLLFGLETEDLNHTLNDFIWGECEIDATIHDLTEQLSWPHQHNGRLFLAPASSRPQQVARILRGGFFYDLLANALHLFTDAADLHFLLVDAPAGLTEVTHLATAASDINVIVMRPDQQDFLGTGLMLDVTEKLEVPLTILVVNEVPRSLEMDAVQEEVEEAYNYSVTAVLPHTQALTILGSSDIFMLRYPQHPLAQLMNQIASALAVHTDL